MEGEVAMATGSGGTLEPTAEQPQLPATTGVLPAQNGEPTVVYVREPSRWSRRLLVFLITLAVLIGIFFGLKSLHLLPSFPNPFATKTTDRSGPVLLQSMQDLSRYEAAEGNFQVLVDLQENNRFIPDFIFNQRTLFVGVGSVNAYVDFSGLTKGQLVVSPDGKSVELHLPAPVLDKPSLDVNRSYVFAEQRGVFNRVEDLFNGDPNKQQELYKLAQDKIAQAAEDSELRSRAEKNTRSMLESLLKQLGFEKITIVFAAS
jgi:Protein of unknown function (DUF4230)